MTYDNDLAFALHTTVYEELKTRSFFTHPFTSQEKGTVENRIGVTSFEELNFLYPKNRKTVCGALHTVHNYPPLRL
jgi:hypothetical protein